jgi:hypothetical protein
MRSKSSLFTVFILFATFASGIFFYKSCMTSKEKVPQIDTTLFIDKIETVLKMVSVEGHYTEMLKYDNSTYDFPGFRKKALVQVTGKVLVGYNMEKYKMNYDVKNKTLNITQFPPAEILAIEANTKYFDMEQGIFNSFTKEELTNIDKKSKEAIRNKALSDHLIKTAEDQKNELLMLMLDPLFADNWKITIQGKEITKPAITINKN